MRTIFIAIFTIGLLAKWTPDAHCYPYDLTTVDKARIAEHLPFGLPCVGDLRIHEGYVLAHDSWLKVPRWVAYHVSSMTLIGETKRKDDFRADPEFKPWQRAENSDYKGTPFDRGHMAPAAAMKRSTTAMSESFLLSNMVPQLAAMNRGIWAFLEDKVREWSIQRGEGWVFAGPVFKDTDDDHVIQFKTIGKNGVAVPTHLFMILASKNRAGHLEAIAFMLPNEAAKREALPTFAVSIREIENATGLNFLANLPDEEENRLEENAVVAVWD